ncbi:Protein kinase domain containing protein [Musa troglodytarum]|uniref:non-specific serine/threonine protein kinase n=1 Tax=Musa troglodytarum TaxID=320322 RepID=A0A9E7K169_9LILI|nr:Protein kinase domain containing protein [Musa troglodytarum]
MRQLFSKSRSLRRLMSVGIGRRSREAESTKELASPVKSTWRCFSYEEIHAATDGFHKDNLVGRGGYAVVYRGVTADGQAIAVKTMVGASTDEQREKDFLTELGTVGHVRHPNVSALLGCCIDRGLHLVFEFSSRGSVSSNLHDASSPPMAWKLRHGIAVGTARGLHYLHKECPRRIIHRDIKASNVLLTANFQPQISDFGLAKWLPSEWTHRAISPIEGTFGYILLNSWIQATHSDARNGGADGIHRCLAPEYFMHGIVDEKTDVFAFGVFLLEIISGRKPVDGSHRSLLSWVNARPFLDDGSLQMLVDPRLGDGYDMEQLKRLSFAASLCIRATAALRPSMTEILELLEGGEISQDRWKMLEEEEVEEEFWGFDDLDDDDDDDDCDTPSTPSTGSSQP